MWRTACSTTTRTPRGAIPSGRARQTIWERWGRLDGKPKAFQDPGMKQFSTTIRSVRLASGCTRAWRALIWTPNSPRTSTAFLHPHPGGGLTYARATYDSIHGRIVSDWKLENGQFVYHVTVPANTTATVYVPAASAEQVTEGSKPAGKAAGVTFVRMEKQLRRLRSRVRGLYIHRAPNCRQPCATLKGNSHRKAANTTSHDLAKGIGLMPDASTKQFSRPVSGGLVGGVDEAQVFSGVAGRG